MGKRRARSAPIAPTRKQISRREAEERFRRRLLLGTGLVLALALLLVGWAIIEEHVLRPRRPVVTVHEEPISLRDYQALVRYRRWEYRNYLAQLEAQQRELLLAEEPQEAWIELLGQQRDQVQAAIMNLPLTVLDELIDASLARQELARRGISLSDDAIERAMEQLFGYDRDAALSAEPEVAPTPLSEGEPTPLPTAAPLSESEYRARRASYLTAMTEATGLTDAEYRRLVVEPTVLRERLAEELATELPTVSEQVRARHILVASREEAEAALASLRAGEPFAEVAEEVSIDYGTASVGGDLGWFPRGRMVEAFEEAAFSQAPGELGEPVESDYGWHIILVEEHDPARPLDPLEIDAAREQAVEEWLRLERASDAVQRHWDSTMVPADN